MKKEYLYVIITGILSGFIVFLGNIFLNLGLSLFELSFMPQILIVIFLIPIILFNKKYQVIKGSKWLWILYGFVTFGALLLQYSGIYLGVPIAIVLLLLYTQPLWTVVISFFILKEKIRKQDVLACILVLIGVAILVNPFSLKAHSLLGIILSLLGGIALSGWVVIGSFVSKNKSPPVTTKFLNALLTVIILLISYPILFNFVKNPAMTGFSFNFSLTAWLLLLFSALIVEIWGHILYYKGAAKIPTVDAGIILLLEPVVGTLLATIFLSQALTLNIIIGGLLIILANYITIKYN